MEDLSIGDVIGIHAMIYIPNKEEMIRILRLLLFYRGTDFNLSDIQSEADSLWETFNGDAVYDSEYDFFRELEPGDDYFELIPSLAVTS